MNSKVVVHNDIGAYPDPSAAQVYPSDSGYVVSGLLSSVDAFPINETGLKSAIADLNPTFVGLDGQGAINFDKKFLEPGWFVDSQGQISFERPGQNFNQFNQAQLADEQLNKISVTQLLENVTFYTADPNLVPFQPGFKFSHNETNISNGLKNGDQIWVSFNILQSDNNQKKAVEGFRPITTQLLTVSGLTTTSDPMNSL